jgi:hypothetical protein
VAVDQLDQLTTGIAGSAKDRRADTHEIAKYTHMRMSVGRGRGTWRWCVVREKRFTFYVLRRARVGGRR